MEKVIKMSIQRMAVILVSITTLSLISREARSQDSAAATDKLLAWASSVTPGCSVAISSHGKIIYQKAVGAADLDAGKAMEPNTTFDIGSTRKQFIAAAILLLASDKKLSLTDDVHRFFPKLPDYGKKITLDHLLTHTSGIRDWTGMQPLAADDPDAMTLIMRQKDLNFAPGEEWSYSNSGYVLLAEIVSKAGGMPLADFLNKRIFQPLGMKSTSYVVNLRGEVKNRATAYKKTPDGFVKDMLLDNDRGGAGALFSTAADLLLWNDALSDGKLGKQITEKLQQATKLNNGRVLNYGRGLVLEGNLIWHSGGAAGYHSWIGRVPDQQLSIAVLCNSDQVSASSLADRILMIYAPTAGLPKGEDGPPPVLTGETLTDAKKFAGLFVNDGSEILRLAIDRDRFRILGGPGLTPTGKGSFRRWGAGVFYMSQDEFKLNFSSPNELELQTMEGKKISYRRAEPYVPTTAELASFVGKFISPEIGGFFEFTAGDGVLIAKANGKGEPITLRPLFRDAFQVAGVVIRFIRNADGKPVSLDYSNPVVRNIRFTRSQM